MEKYITLSSNDPLAPSVKMWSNLQAEYEYDLQQIRKIPKRVVEKRTELFINALVQTMPRLRSDLLRLLPEFHAACMRAECSPVVLGEGNADWLAITLISNVVCSPIAQKVLVELLKDGVLLNSMALTETSSHVHESFIPCHVVTYGAYVNIEPLFRECIHLAAYLDEKIITAEVVYALEERLRRRMGGVHVAHFPNEVTCASFRKTHTLNMNPPLKRGSIYQADLSRVKQCTYNGRLQVGINKGVRENVFICSLFIPVNIVENNYTFTYELPVVEIRCDTDRTRMPMFRSVPSSIGKLPVPPWLEFCKFLTPSRRGIPAMAIASVFWFQQMWVPSNAQRLRDIRTMVLSQGTLDGVTRTEGITVDELKRLECQARRVVLLLIDAVAATASLHGSTETTYISSITLR